MKGKGKDRRGIVANLLWATRRAPGNSLAALRARNEQYRLLVEGILDYAIYLLDPDGVVSSWNVGAERLKGYSTDEIIGSHFSVFYSSEDQRAGVPARALEVAAAEGKYEAEGWRIRRDGGRFWASVVIDALRDSSGELIGFANITRDITPRLLQQQQLDEAQARLVQAQKMEAVGQLTGGVAHDFNNLLTTILGNTELIEKRYIGDEAATRRLLGAVRRAAEHGVSLTGRLLAFSRSQALTPRVIDINRLVGSVAETLRHTLGEQIDVETVLAGGLWRSFADTSQLENALLNLAINARDAMPAGGKLTIETANSYLDEEYAESHLEVVAGQYVMLAVTDSGTGMSAEVMQRAFEPFFTTKSDERGTGLGLSQVYGFVKQSGGHIKLYSEIGQGTTVKVYLPRHVGADLPEMEPARPDVASLARGETVLLVEDAAEVREYAADALRLLGYRVIEAPDGDSALRLVDRHPEIAILLTDVGLPRMNGRQLAEQTAQRIPGVRVLFISGYARNAIVHQGLLDVGVDLLAKPFTLNSLGRKLRELIDRG